MVSVEELERMADIPISGIDRKEVAKFGSIKIDEGKQWRKGRYRSLSSPAIRISAGRGTMS